MSPSSLQGWLRTTDAKKTTNDPSYRAACRCRDIQREHWPELVTARGKRQACRDACDVSAQYTEAEQLRRLAESKAKEEYEERIAACKEECDARVRALQQERDAALDRAARAETELDNLLSTAEDID